MKAFSLRIKIVTYLKIVIMTTHKIKGRFHNLRPNINQRQTSFEALVIGGLKINSLINF